MTNKTIRNPILSAMKARVALLRGKLAESDTICHPGTKGDLREAYLKDFVVDVFPARFELTSGFVVGSNTEDISPQLDLIVIEPADASHVALSLNASLVPIESCRSWIEVKSVLRQGDFMQFRCQSETIAKFKFALTSWDRKFGLFGKAKTIPGFIFAYSSSGCDADTILEWMKFCPALTGVCVFGKFCVIAPPVADELNGVEPTVIRANGNDSEILHFVTHLVLMNQVMNRLMTGRDWKSELRPDVGAYLTFDGPEE